MKFALSTLLKKEYLLLYLIILFGAFLRANALFTNTFAFTYDVGRDMLALWNIVVSQKLSLIGPTTGLPGVFYGPWWYLILTPFFAVFSGDPRGIAFAMFLFGILTIALSYYLGIKIIGKFFAFSFALLVSVSANMIFLSSQIWNPNIIPFFTVSGFIILYNIYSAEKIKNHNFFLLGIVSSLAIDLEIIFGILFSFGLIVSLFLTKSLNIKRFLFFITGALIIAFPKIFFELRHDFLMTNSLIKYFLAPALEKTSIIDTAFNRVAFFFNEFNYTLTSANAVLGFIAIIFIFTVIFVFYKKSNNLIKKFVKTTLIIFIVFFLGTTFFSRDIWPHYLVGLPVLFIFIFSLCLNLLGIKLKSFILPFIALLFLLFINLNPIKILSEFGNPWEGDASVYRNQLAAIDYIYTQAKGKDFKYVLYTPPVNDYTYQYLFKWYGPKNYRYSPSVQSNLAFFILEPDFENPSRLKDWLKQREGDGKIIKSEKIKGGIVVQTRTN